jgi:NADH-ubiquinone oxidoreductase chain 5
MYLTLIIFPLLGSISSGFFGRKIGVRGSHLLTCTFVLITTILSIMSFFEVGFNNIAVEIKLFR